MSNSKNTNLRFVTASSLFDGHDASINMFRRLFQKAGIEVIHLGHNRSVQDIVTTAIQEDADAICISSYQGGHMEYFKYMVDLLKENNVGHIKIFGGGGGTILPKEIEELHKYGVARLYHAEDSRKLGLDGVINDIINKATKERFDISSYDTILSKIKSKKTLGERELGKIISLFENDYYIQIEETDSLRKQLIQSIEQANYKRPIILGITGPGGAGKSSLTDELVNRFLYTTKDTKIGILAYDPSKRKTGGALLGDRIRMNSIYDSRVYVRSIATHGQSREVGGTIKDIQTLFKAGEFDVLILETSGIGQGDSAIVDFCDKSIYVMTSEYGAQTQLEKIDMIDFADLVAINKFDKRGAEDALMDVRLVFARSREVPTAPENLKKLPVFGTTASSFNDQGVNHFFNCLISLIGENGNLKSKFDSEALKNLKNNMDFSIIPPDRQNYLAEISKTVRDYKKETANLQETASELYKLKTAKSLVDNSDIETVIDTLEHELGEENLKLIKSFDSLKEVLEKDNFEYEVRGKKFSKPLFSTSLSDKKIPKIATAGFLDWGDKL
ncbi:MAG: methylmalonyl-CoA mutase family protein, partial [Bdellovibrionales bacterium]|nr:methylmalonyl-CoA mutase family protein [Bdellovibrionales bacterium]